MAFGHLLRSAVVTRLFYWFPKNKCTKFDPNGQKVPKKFERYMKMGHIWVNLLIYRPIE